MAFQEISIGKINNAEKIYDEIRGLPAFRRANQVRQLGTLVDPGIPNQIFLHSRGDHLQQTASSADLTMKENGFLADDLPRVALNSAMLLHDIGMPAGSEFIKGIDPRQLHEETHWQNALGQTNGDLMGFMSRMGHETVLLINDIINNRNDNFPAVVGDIIDRASYTTADAHEIIANAHRNRTTTPIASTVGEILLKNPHIEKFYEFIRITPVDGIFEQSVEVYFEEPDALKQILRLRAQLHGLYHNPINKAREIATQALVRPMYQKGILTPDSLRQMTDRDLYLKVSEQYGLPSTAEGEDPLTGYQLEFSALANGDMPSQGKGWVSLGGYTPRMFDTGTGYKIRDGRTYTPVRFDQAYPHEANKIKLIAIQNRVPHQLFARGPKKLMKLLTEETQVNGKSQNPQPKPHGFYSLN